MLGNRQRRHRSGIEQVGGEQLRLPPFVPDEISFQWSSPEAFLHTGGGGDWTTTDKCLYATLELKQLGLSYVEAFKVLNESHPYGLHQSLADTIHAVTFVYEITDGELLNVLNPPFFEAARGEVFSRALFALGRSRVQVFDAYIEAVHPQDPIDQAYWLILHDRTFTEHDYIETAKYAGWRPGWVYLTLLESQYRTGPASADERMRIVDLLLESWPKRHVISAVSEVDRLTGVNFWDRGYWYRFLRDRGEPPEHIVRYLDSHGAGSF
jgi:hypothetical protein